MGLAGQPQDNPPRFPRRYVTTTGGTRVTRRIFRNATGNAWAPARVDFYSGEVSSTLRNRFTMTNVGKFSMTLTICHVVVCHRNVGH